MRHRPAHLGRRLVVMQTLIDHLPQQVAAGPGEILDLGDQLRPNRMHAAEYERRSEPAGARRVSWAEWCPMALSANQKDELSNGSRPAEELYRQSRRIM